MRRNPVAALAWVVGLCLLVAGAVLAAVTTVQSETYALRPCSTCTEIRYPTEAECEAAALAEARRVGETRTTGSAVYTCITRHNVIATFRVDSRGTATLSWTPPTRNSDGTTLTNLAGYRVHYGQSATALAQTIQLANAGTSSYIVSNLAPGTYYFAVRAYTTAGTESALSNIESKVVQ
jgi:hypothetical protein